MNNSLTASRKNKSVTRLTGRARFYATVANGNSSTSFVIQPSSFSRLVSIQKAYEFYRFTKLRLRVPPFVRFETTYPANSEASSGAIGYYPEVFTSSQTAIQAGNLLSLEASMPLCPSIVNENSSASGGTGVLAAPGYTKDVILNVPKSVLLSTPTKWWRTQATASSEDLFITQGTLVVAFDDTAGASTVQVPIDFQYEIEFSAQVDAIDINSPPPPLQWQRVLKETDDEKEEGFSKVQLPLVVPRLVRGK